MNDVPIEYAIGYDAYEQGKKFDMSWSIESKLGWEDAQNSRRATLLRNKAIESQI